MRGGKKEKKKQVRDTSICLACSKAYKLIHISVNPLLMCYDALYVYMSNIYVFLLIYSDTPFYIFVFRLILDGHKKISNWR